MRILGERGRVALILEPRDTWVGLYWDSEYVYITVVPCLPVRITR
jgi:hypothetical protein